MTVLADTTILGTARAGGADPASHPVTRTRRPAVPRRPALRRPGGRPLSYAGIPAYVRLSCASHGPTRVQVVRRRVVAWAVLTLFVVAAVAGLVSLRSAGAAVVPSATSVVQVQAGENLSTLAGRVAPDAPTAAVVERIVSLNGLTGATVRPGESLVVPMG